MIGWMLIYKLCDPRTHRARYVGMTSWKKDGPEASLRRRWYAHLDQNAPGTRARNEWVTELRSQGLRPTIHLLEVVPPHSAFDAETKWMHFLTEQGADLTNGDRRVSSPRSVVTADAEPTHGWSENGFELKVFTVNATGISGIQIVPIGAKHPPSDPTERTR